MSSYQLPSSESGGVELARFAGLLADPSRAEMCMALLDGRAWTASELARRVGVAPSTATEHLNRLIGGGLLIEHRQGRHRYVQLAGPHIAHLLEDLTAHITPSAVPARSLRAATVSAAMARARTCYDHFAGRLGVEIADAMGRTGRLELDAGVALTDTGTAWLKTALRIDVSTLPATRRPVVRSCLDWTERRPHLAGSVGALICQRFLEQDWISRVGTSRAVRVNPSGLVALRDLFDIDPATVS